MSIISQLCEWKNPAENLEFGQLTKTAFIYLWQKWTGLEEVNKIMLIYSGWGLDFITLWIHTVLQAENVTFLFVTEFHLMFIVPVKGCLSNCWFLSRKMRLGTTFSSPLPLKNRKLIEKLWKDWKMRCISSVVSCVDIDGFNSGIIILLLIQYA